MRIDYYRLRISIADYSYALVSFELVKFFFKFCSEISALKAMNRPAETAFGGIECCHTGTPCAEVRVIVHTVEQIGAAGLPRGYSKESSHILIKCRLVFYGGKGTKYLQKNGVPLLRNCYLFIAAIYLHILAKICVLYVPY